MDARAEPHDLREQPELTTTSFALPELRVGTLDSLMVLSDELVKVNGLVESVVNKVRRQLFEMGAINGGDTQEARPRPIRPA